MTKENKEDNIMPTYSYGGPNKEADYVYGSTYATLGELKKMMKSKTDDIKNKLGDIAWKQFINTIGETITLQYINDNKIFQIEDYIYGLNLHKYDKTMLSSNTLLGIQKPTVKRMPIDNVFLCKDKQTICIVKHDLMYDNDLNAFMSQVAYSKTSSNYILSVTFIGKYAKYYKKRVYKLYHKLFTNNLRGDFIEYYSDRTDYKITMKMKSFDYVICSQKQKLINSIDRFCASKDLYYKHNITYQLGILLYGEPGCGKTSMIKAITEYVTSRHEYGILRWIELSLSSAKDIQQTINEFIRAQSSLEAEKSVMNIVLMEELDQVCDAKRDSDKDSAEMKAKVNTILQFLDGVYSTNNTIVIATTNYIDKLDKALIRDGRFDCKIRMEPFNEEEAKQFCDLFGADYSVLDGKQYPIVPATLQKELFNIEYTKMMQ